MKNLKITLNDLADYSGFNVRTLKAWEKAGLFTVSRNSDNDYRIPKYSDICNIMEVAFFKRIKMTNGDIKSIYNNNMNNLIDIFSNKIEDLGNYVDELNHCIDVLKRQRETLLMSKNNLNNPFVKTNPPFDALVPLDFSNEKCLPLFAKSINNVVTLHKYTLVPDEKYEDYAKYITPPPTIYDNIMAYNGKYLAKNILYDYTGCLIDDNSTDMPPVWTKSNDLDYYLCTERLTYHNDYNSTFYDLPFRVDWYKEALMRNLKINVRVSQYVAHLEEVVDGKKAECFYFNHYMQCSPIDDNEKDYMLNILNK